MNRISLKPVCASAALNSSSSTTPPSELAIAMGSASELECHFLLAHDLNLLDDAAYNQLGTQVREVKRMLTSLVQKVAPNRQHSKHITKCQTPDT